MIRLGSRKDGNTEAYSIPISVVEPAAEYHNVLKKTINNNTAKESLLTILFDELCQFTMKFKNNVVKRFNFRLMQDCEPLKVSYIYIYIYIYIL